MLIALPKDLAVSFLDSMYNPSKLIPSETLLRRYELSLDVALLLTEQEHSYIIGPLVLLSWIDSSPMAGFDWLWSAHHEVAIKDLIPLF